MRRLAAEAQLANDRPVLLEVCSPEVLQEPAATSYHFQKAAPAVVVLGVAAKMLGEVLNPRGELSHLHGRRPAVIIVATELFYDFLFLELASAALYFFSNTG